jgi:hypothetical protein
MLGFLFSITPDTSGSTFGSQPFDVSRYSGIRFWGRDAKADSAGQEVDVHLANIQTSSEHTSSLCWDPEDLAERCSDNFRASVMLTSEWQEFTVEWKDLHQSGEDWSAHFDSFDPNAYNIIWMVNGHGPGVPAPGFDFCLADIYFLP